MKPTGHFLSQDRQDAIRKYEVSDRIVVGFAKDYPSGLITGMHAHPRAQVIFGVSGVMKVETPNSTFVVPPTSALMLPAELMHSISMEGDVAMRELFLRKEVAAKLGTETRMISVSPLLRELMVAACSEPVDWDLHGRTNHIVELIISEVMHADVLPTELPLPRDPRVAKVAKAIIAAPADPRCIDDWGEFCGTSSRTLARLFVKQTGVSFGQWRLKARLNAAFVLLMTDVNIAEVSVLVGFKSQSAFTVAFRRTFGMTPGQARGLNSLGVISNVENPAVFFEN